MTTSRSLRNLITTIVLLVPATAYAVPNNGVPNNACERAATADYQANLQNCKTHLQGDAQAITQCQEDASYDYLDSIAACAGSDTPARTNLGGSFGQFDNVVDADTVSPKAPMSVKKSNLKFGAF